MTEKELKIIAETEAFVSEHSKGNDPGHDILHINRVLRLCRKIYKDYLEADPFLCELIALLHDMNDHKLTSRMNAKGIGDFLRSFDLEDETINFVISGIDKISFSKYPNPNPHNPIEVQIVQDADRLDAMGAVGIARTFSYGGAKGIPFYTEDNSQGTIKHFEEKLLLLKDLLNTDIARQMAAKKHKVLKDFYHVFLEEIQ